MKNKLAVSCCNEIFLLAISKIIRLEADSPCTRIYMEENKKYSDYRNLGTLEKELPPYFFRVHFSHIVNLKKVVKIKKSESLAVMSDGSEVPIARDRKEEFLERALNQ